MFYHGEPHEKDPKEVRDASPFRKSDIGQAMKKSDELFTSGLCKTTFDELKKRQERHKAVIKSDVFTIVRASNLAAVQRRFAESIASMVPVTILPSFSSFSSSGGSKKPSTPMKAPPSPVAAPQQVVDGDAPSSPTSPSVQQQQLAGGGPMIPIAKIVDVLRHDYEIHNANLLEALAASLGGEKQATAIPFFTWMTMLDQILNNPIHSNTTRLACFRVFDLDQVRVITAKNIRHLRMLKLQQIYEQTDGGNFLMVKSMLDLFCHPDSAWTSTLSQEDFLPLLDCDENLVQGFLEEIVRQLLVQKHDCDRNDLLISSTLNSQNVPQIVAAAS